MSTVLSHTRWSRRRRRRHCSLRSSDTYMFLLCSAITDRNEIFRKKSLLYWRFAGNEAFWREIRMRGIFTPNQPFFLCFTSDPPRLPVAVARPMDASGRDMCSTGIWVLRHHVHACALGQLKTFYVFFSLVLYIVRQALWILHTRYLDFFHIQVTLVAKTATI